VHEDGGFCRVFKLQCHPQTVLGLLFLFPAFLFAHLEGITVIEFITLKDKFGNLGVRYVLSFFPRHLFLTIFSLVQEETNEVAGDGTTTATILAIHSEAVKHVAAGCKP